MCYAGDVYNVCHSLMIGSAMVGMDIYVAAPKAYKPAPEILECAQKHAAANGSRVIVTEDFDEALRNADVVYGNTWHSMGENEEQKENAFTILCPIRSMRRRWRKRVRTPFSCIAYPVIAEKI